jgi:hypothetical protein
MVLDDDPYPADPFALVVEDEPGEDAAEPWNEPWPVDALPAATAVTFAAPVAPPRPGHTPAADPVPVDTWAPLTPAPAPAPAPATSARRTRTGGATPARRPAHAGPVDIETSIATGGGMTPQAVLMADRLRAAGLPGTDVDRVVAAMAGGRRFTDLLVDLFCRLPAPPPLPGEPGSVVAVTGPLTEALQAARDVAAELGTDPGQVVVLSPHRPAAALPAAGRQPATSAGTDELVSAVNHLRQRRTVVVVVDSGFVGTSRTWAAHALARLHPTTVWGVVDAVAKPEDVAAWAAGLGGLDALVVDNLAATVSPAAVLRTGVPVVRLDGEPATPERWAAALGDLVAA